MKKIVSLLLCLAVMLGVTASALALSVSPGTDRTAVSVGEDITVTLSLDEALKAVNTTVIRVYYDEL